MLTSDFLTKNISISLVATMLVAIATVHNKNYKQFSTHELNTLTSSPHDERFTFFTLSTIILEEIFVLSILAQESIAFFKNCHF